VSDQVQSAEQHASPSGSIIETLQSLIIAFAFAFIFRAFVAEAFVIPTGSMAPTLNGAHLLASSPDSGYKFDVGAIDVSPGRGSEALPRQGQNTAIVLPDPMLDTVDGRASDRLSSIRFQDARTRMGDRILVLKYLYTFFEPKRFDVVVFKNPTDPSVNFIKRLIGLPGETIWLADGDVFASTSGPTGAFRIQRKPEYIQRAVWQPVYHSEYIPLHPERIIPAWKSPWQGDGWDTTGRSYSHASASPSVLSFARDTKPVTDRNPYNEAGRQYQNPAFWYPTADLRFSAGVEVTSESQEFSILLEARQHEFEARFASGSCTLRMRPSGADQAPWSDLATAPVSLPVGSVSNVEFWHVDQAMTVWVDGEQIVSAAYEWEPDERLRLATGLDTAGARALGARQPWRNPDHHPSRTALSLHFSAGPVSLHRVNVDRDLYYQPAEYTRIGGGPGLATHPDNLAVLKADQFFCCGDNSAASSDGRLWDPPVPWVAYEVDPTRGIVNRDLLLGKAFFVYFPSPEGITDQGMRFVPGFGAMRFIR